MKRSLITIALVGAALILFGTVSSIAIADDTLVKQSETTVFFTIPEAISPIQATLTWDTNFTDLDMHIFGPAGGHAFFGNPAGVPGGVYIVDDVDGFGPEVFNGPTAQNGMYGISVDAFADVSGANPTTATLTIVNSGTIIFSGTYVFTASDGNAGNGIGTDSASFWDAHHFTAVPGVSTKTKVKPMGTTTNGGNWSCRNPTSWLITAPFPSGTTGATLGAAVSSLLNSGPATDGGFAAAGCTASFVSEILEINCPEGAPVEIEFDGGGFVPLIGATINGLTIEQVGLPVPALSQGMIAFLSLLMLMLVGGFSVQRRRITVKG